MPHKILKAILIFIFIFSFAQNAFCAQNHIEKKRKETHAKVVRLKRLETIETNKLYKNQQRLENATKTLNSSKSNMLTPKHSFKKLKETLMKRFQIILQLNFNQKTESAKFLKNKDAECSSFCLQQQISTHF